MEPLLNSGDGKAQQLGKLCGNIKDIISACVPPKCVMNEATTCFSEFLGSDALKYFGRNLMLVAESYPHAWTDERKGTYLIQVMSSALDLKAFKKSGIQWPTSGDNHDEIEKIQKIIDDDNKEKQHRKTFLESQGRGDEAKKIKIRTWNYVTTFPDHLVRMVRNFWKHYDTLPWKLQVRNGPY